MLIFFKWSFFQSTQAAKRKSICSDSKTARLQWWPTRSCGTNAAEVRSRNQTAAEVMWCWILAANKMPDFHIHNCRLCHVSDDYDHLKQCLVSWADKKTRPACSCVSCLCEDFCIFQELSVCIIDIVTRWAEHLKTRPQQSAGVEKMRWSIFYEKEQQHKHRPT